jgi:hypothetical protein
MTPLQLSQGTIFALRYFFFAACIAQPRKFCSDSLYRLCSNLSTRQNIHKIYGDTRRACVAIIIRWRRGYYDRTPIDTSLQPRSWMEFVQDKMVQRDGGYPEILYIRRAKRAGDP